MHQRCLKTPAPKCASVLFPTVKSNRGCRNISHRSPARAFIWSLRCCPAVCSSVLNLCSEMQQFRKETNSLEACSAQLLGYSPPLHPLASSSETPGCRRTFSPLTHILFSRGGTRPVEPGRRRGLQPARPADPLRGCGWPSPGSRGAQPGPAGDAGAALTWAPAPPGLLRLPAP